MMGLLRRIAKRILGERFANWYRRKRATRRYLRALSYELLERETRLDEIEGRVAARRDGFYERMVHEVLERTEIVLQELDRRIEGLSARTGQRLSEVEEQLARLREEMARLGSALQAERAASVAGEPVRGTEEAAPAVRE